MIKIISIRFITFCGISASLLFMCTGQVFAQAQYRCSGLVQYRPCDDDRAVPALLNQTKKAGNNVVSPRAQMKPSLNTPTVFSTKYEYNGKNSVGVWTGFVHGDGPIVLRLRLNVQGAPPEVRYMGKATLRGKVSPFEFRSTPPKGSRWSWQIFAKNEDI